MPAEGNKRPPRVPRSQEEVELIVLQKKIREHNRLARFKQTGVYKAFNIFNVISFCIYCELIMCFIGPCHYETHYSRNVTAEHGMEKNVSGNAIVVAIKIVAINGKHYRFPVNEFIATPKKFSAYNIGKDFFLQKELRGTVTTSDHIFRISAAEPIFFLSLFVAFFSFIFFAYNLNEHPYPLAAITFINAITVLAFVML